MIQNEVIIEKLEGLDEAVFQLVRIWESLSESQKAVLEDSYPFEQSFDEIGYNINSWTQQVRESLKNK